MKHDEQIVSRFYMAVDALYALGEIHRIRELERDMGVNHGNFYQQRKDYTSNITCCNCGRA